MENKTRNTEFLKDIIQQSGFSRTFSTFNQNITTSLWLKMIIHSLQMEGSHHKKMTSNIYYDIHNYSI